jgi:hypothetical protein
MALLIAHHYDFMSPRVETGEDSAVEPYGTVWMDHAAFNVFDFGYSIAEIACARSWTLTDAGDGVLIIDLNDDASTTGG